MADGAAWEEVFCLIVGVRSIDGAVEAIWAEGMRGFMLLIMCFIT